VASVFSEDHNYDRSTRI